MGVRNPCEVAMKFDLNTIRGAYRNMKSRDFCCFSLGTLGICFFSTCFLARIFQMERSPSATCNLCNLDPTWRIIPGLVSGQDHPCLLPPWSSVIWKGSHNLRSWGRNRSPWLLTTYPSVLGWSSKYQLPPPVHHPPGQIEHDLDLSQNGSLRAPNGWSTFFGGWVGN